jgi:DNA-binding NarL/FixJ family response regulator
MSSATLNSVDDPDRMRCIIVDDSAAFCAAARGTLEAAGIAVVGTATTLVDALEKAQTSMPDVVLVDIDLGGESGFDVVEALAASTHSPATILISTHDEDEFADMVDASSAIGFVPKFALSADRIRQMLTGRR